MSRRFVVGLTVCCLGSAAFYVVLALSVRGRQVVTCPQCHAVIPESDLHRKPDRTSYHCRKCLHFWSGPARSDFSWPAAAEGLLE